MLARDNSGGPQELNEPQPFREPNDVHDMTEEEGHSLVQANQVTPATVPTTVPDDDVQQCVEEQGNGVKGTYTPHNRLYVRTAHIHVRSYEPLPL